MSIRLILGVGVAAAVLALAALAAGVTGDRGSEPRGSVSASEPERVSVAASAVAPPVQHLRPNVPDYHILPEQLDGWLSAATPAERALIEDGVLTFEEYESAVLSTLTCIEDAGLRVTSSSGYGRGYWPQVGPRLSSRGEYTYGASVPGSPDVRPDAARAAFSACKAGSAQIEFMWAQHLAPSEVEYQAMREHMAACLRPLGATVPERPSDADLAAVRSQGVGLEAYRACQFAAADAFEIDRLPG